MEILFEIDGIEFTLFDIIIVIFAVFLLIRKLFMFDIEIYSEIFPSEIRIIAAVIISD